jgi:hypothetical protein
VHSAATLPRAKIIAPGRLGNIVSCTFATLQVDYSAVSHPRPKTDCCWLAEWIVTPPGKMSGIPILSCWSQSAEDWECFLSQEALLKKLHASHEWVPTMKNCQPLLREQKPDPLFLLETRFYWIADSLGKN